MTVFELQLGLVTDCQLLSMFAEFWGVGELSLTRDRYSWYYNRKNEIAMPYSEFTTIGKVKLAFGLTTQEGIKFLPELAAIAPATGLTGVCDFLISRSPELLEIEAPAVVIVEAKKADLKTGIGQCVAEMVAAQKFNEAKGHPISVIYGSVSSGSQWRFLKLEGQTVTIDLTDYPLPPVDYILGILVWMVKNA